MSVREPEYGGVNVNHPRIKEAVKELTKQGKNKEYIAKVTGMPHEVVEKHQRSGG